MLFPHSDLKLSDSQDSDILLAEVGALIRTRSTTKSAYACKPSASHPIDGNNLKYLLVAVESLEREASSKLRRNTESRYSRAS